MVVRDYPWWTWFLPFVFGAPWLTAIVWYWRRASPREGPAPESAAELARNRLWT